MTVRQHLFACRVVIVNALCAVFLTCSATGASEFLLDNGEILARFDETGLSSMSLTAQLKPLKFREDPVAITIDGRKFSVASLPVTQMTRGRDSITYTYGGVEGKRIQMVYELRPGWRFLSKRILLTLSPGTTCRVDSLEVLCGEFGTHIAEEHKANHASGVVFLRFDRSDLAAKIGIFLALQNPFLEWTRSGQRVAMSYEPGMEWRAEYGPFASDRVCIGIYGLSGNRFPAQDLPEWRYVPDPGNAFEGAPMLDLSDVDAVAQCVNAFMLYRPKKSLRVHVPWCENDYQIDIATEHGRDEWKRILDQVASVGCDFSLFTPANSVVAPLKENSDAWGWENCLWLGLGQKIRKGEWDIVRDPIPPSIQEMLDYAKAKKVKLIAYVYPTLGWKQNPEWTAWCGGKTGGYTGVDTGVRSFQDWFVNQLVAFQKRTGIGGYSFDHWWIAYGPSEDGKKRPTSKYAQWFGCRRILEELRRRIPGVVVDGRQQYQWFGVWTWLGGSYPHPTTNDEQPGSFENFPDLHFDRVSADRQRWASWYYRMEQFTPWKLLPGFMTHQTSRYNAEGRCVKDNDFNVRDWDYLGWRYSVISSIGTAPFNHVVNMLPARDEDEFKHFKAEDRQWLRQWMEWTDKYRSTLESLRPIIGPPAVGRIDGTAAFKNGDGFIFLFNPNYREMDADFTLGTSIGLQAGKDFILRELYPRKGMLLGQNKSSCLWHYGDQVRLTIKGPEALVLEVLPARGLKLPALFNVSGQASLKGDRLILTDVLGETGTTTDLAVLLPRAQRLSTIVVNGHVVDSFSQEGDFVTMRVTFDGPRVRHCQQIGDYDADFSNSVWRAAFAIPQRVFDQLAARRRAWPISYTSEDLLATWRGSDRLLLYIDFAEPDDQWHVGLKLNGKSVDVKKAYSDLFGKSRKRTFTGFYADISDLDLEVRYNVEIQLPDALESGQFQGLYMENVEQEFTSKLAEQN